MGIGPVAAIRAVLEHSGLRLEQIDRFEINEAFGAQVLACERELGLDHARLNVNGGAIAIGHPLGATGVRLAITLARELKRSGGKYGIASACIGGGQGIALLLENVGSCAQRGHPDSILRSASDVNQATLRTMPARFPKRSGTISVAGFLASKAVP